MVKSILIGQRGALIPTKLNADRPTYTLSGFGGILEDELGKNLHKLYWGCVGVDVEQDNFK